MQAFLNMTQPLNEPRQPFPPNKVSQTENQACAGLLLFASYKSKIWIIFSSFIHILHGTLTTTTASIQCVYATAAVHYGLKVSCNCLLITFQRWLLIPILWSKHQIYPNRFGQWMLKYRIRFQQQTPSPPSHSRLSYFWSFVVLILSAVLNIYFLFLKTT